MYDQPLPAKPVRQVDAKCMNCAFWRETKLAGPVEIGAPKRGLCWAVPPTPVIRFVNGNPQGQTNVRPATAEGEMCYAFFTPLAMSE
jgi:hypothetical protein